MTNKPWPADPRSYRWLIDGHNAIFTHPELEALQVEGSRAEARRRLEVIVERIGALHGFDAVIVYDGNRMERNPDARRLGRVRTVYSNGPDEEADDRIVLMAAAWVREGARVAVVTSDRATLAARLPGGVRIVPPSEMFRRGVPPPERGPRKRPAGDFSDIEGYFLSLDPVRETTLPAAPLPERPAPVMPPRREAAPAPPRPRQPAPSPTPQERNAREIEKKKMRGKRAQARRLASYGSQSRKRKG